MRPRALIAPLAVAIVLRVAWILSASTHPALPVDDVDGYLPMAQALAHHQPLAVALRDSVGVLRPPLYPFLLSVPLRFGVPIVWLLVTQIALSCITVAAVAWLCAVTAGPRAATIGAWMAACWPTWVASAATLAGEHLELPLVTVSLALLVIACQRRDAARAAAAGLGFGIAALVRSTSLYLAPMLALVAIPRLGRRAVLVIAGIALVTAPYVAFISREVGRLVVVENLLEWNWRHEQDGSVGPDTGDAPFTGVLGAILGSYRDNPGENARSAAGRLKMMLFRTWSWEASTDEQVPAWAARTMHASAGVAIASLYLFAAIGVVGIPDRRTVRLLVAWTLLHLAADIVGPGIEPRHRAPFEPALIALAAGGVCSVYFLLSWPRRSCLYICSASAMIAIASSGPSSSSTLTCLCSRTL